MYTVWSCIPIGTVLTRIMTLHHLWPVPCRRIRSYSLSLGQKYFYFIYTKVLSTAVGVLINIKCCVMRNKGQVFELGSEKGANFVSGE